MLYDISHLLQKGFLGLSMKPDWTKKKSYTLYLKTQKYYVFPSNQTYKALL